MAINNFDVAGAIWTVNGRQVKDWGETDPPVSVDPIDDQRVLRRGLGGNATGISRSNPGRRVTMNLNPGSPDSAYMSGLAAVVLMLRL